MKTLLVTLVLTVVTASVAHAQSATAAQSARKHPPVCARGVKVFDDIKQVPTPHDTVAVPPSDGPIRVSNEAEAEAAEMALRARAGSVGATGVVITTVEQDNGGGNVTMRRSMIGVYAPADSASSQKACAK
jgi:hypothetical protein